MCTAPSCATPTDCKDSEEGSCEPGAGDCQVGTLVPVEPDQSLQVGTVPIEPGQSPLVIAVVAAVALVIIAAAAAMCRRGCRGRKPEAAATAQPVPDANPPRDEEQEPMVQVDVEMPAAGRQANGRVEQAQPEVNVEVPEAAPPGGITFRTSNFKQKYATAPVPEGALEIGPPLRRLLEWYCETKGIPYHPLPGQNGAGQTMLKRLQAEAQIHGDELAGDRRGIAQVAQRMWTSAQTLADTGEEFCSILNHALRKDDPPDVIQAVAELSRSINELCVQGAAGSAVVHPPDNVCFRGGGFDDRHRGFFIQGKAYRQPAYLATSFSQQKAMEFMRRAGRSPQRVIWRVHIDPVLKCEHVNLVRKVAPGVPDEEEYLFAPYSVFTVRTVAWRRGTVDDPHEIDLDAAPDNQGPPEDLPLAPWS